MRVLKSFSSACLLCLLALSACKEYDSYEDAKDVGVSLALKKGKADLAEGVAADLEYEVTLGAALSKDVTLEFGLINPSKGAVGYTDIFEVSSVVIKAGQTKGTLTIKSKAKIAAQKSLKSDAVYNINLRNFKGPQVNLALDSKKTMQITVGADKGIVILSSSQKGLFGKWKKQGLDFSATIGKVKVSTKVTLSATDAAWVGKPFSASATSHTYTGESVITLGASAAEYKPVLKIAKNAMGLNEFLRQVFRKSTIESATWKRTAAATAVIDAMKEEKDDKKISIYKKWEDKKYPFNVQLDGVYVAEYEKDKDGKIKKESDKADAKPVFKSKTAVSYFRTYDAKKKVYSAFGASDAIHHATDPSKDMLAANRKTNALHFTYDFALYGEVLALTTRKDKTKKLYPNLYPNFAKGGSVQPDFYIVDSFIDTAASAKGSYVKPSVTLDPLKTKTLKFTFPIDWRGSKDYAKVEVTYTFTK